MCGHVEQRVSKYSKLAKKTVSELRQVGTPCVDDDDITIDELETRRELADSSARIVLKALYVARISRPDIYFAVNTLARKVTRWTQACDRRLRRLVSFMHWTQNWVQHCSVGNEPSEMIVAL